MWESQHSTADFATSENCEGRGTRVIDGTGGCASAGLEEESTLVREPLTSVSSQD
jgi:hypothetical protein